MVKDEIIQRIIKVANQNDPDSEVYLYGSRARGDEKVNSDWDFLILLNSENISFDFETKLMDDIYEIELESGEILSPLIYSKNDWIRNRSITPLYENIQIDGVRLK